MIEDRIKRLRDELNERNKEIDIFKGEASKQDISNVSILTAVGMARGVLIEAELGSLTVSTTTSGGTSSGDGKGG